MDEKSAWSEAWSWASEWRGSTPFWVAEVITGLVVGLVVLGVTMSLGWAGAAAGLGAALSFLGGLVWKAWTISSVKRRRYRAAVVQLAENPSVPTPQSTGPSERDRNIKQFSDYVDQQLVKLFEIQSQINQEIRAGDWDDFLEVATRTAAGIGRFDGSLAEYVESTLQKVRNLDYTETGWVIDAILEARTLYTGSAWAPF